MRDPRQPTRPDRLRAGALRHHGCFTTAQAHADGVSDKRLAGLLDRGEIERVHQGVYRFAGLPWTAEARLAAALLAAGPAACASHASAARLLGLTGVPLGRPEVTVAGPARRVPGVRTHRTRAMPPGDVTVVAGLPCTTGSRTLVDLAGRLTEVRRTALVDEAICAGVVSRVRLHERARALRGGRRGVGTLVDLTAPGAEGVFWSALERRLGAGVAASSLPRPRYNAPVRTRGRTFFADALWVQARLVVELHGLRFHRTPSARGSDAERANALTMAGYRVLVFTWRDVVEDLGRVLATIAEALGVSPFCP